MSAICRPRTARCFPIRTLRCRGKSTASPKNTSRRSFKRCAATWCPYSRRQTPIINQLAIHVPVRGIAFDSQPDEVQALRPALAFPVVQGDVDLRQRLGVRSYPTIFFYEGSRLHHVARGLQSPDRLVAVLAALGGGQRPSTLESGDQRLANTCQLRT